MKNKNILVTGGAGFIGSNLVNALVENNKVMVLDNFSSGYRENLNTLAKLIEGDIRIGRCPHYAIKNMDVVFHLAASVGNKRSIDDPVKDALINVIGTINILEAARKEGVKKVVVSSSAGVFGELKTLPIKEDHPCEPDSPYGCSKLFEEKISLAYSRLYKMDIVCLRYFNVYGPNQRYDEYGNVIPIFVIRMLKGEPLIIYGDGLQTRDFVHVDDVVQANINAALFAPSGAYNIASGQSVTINKLASMISDKVEHTSERPGDVRHSLADISKSAEFYKPKVNLEEGIKNYILWVKNTL